MFRFDNILEKWAVVYHSLSHDPAAKAKRRTFFRISMIDANNFFTRNFAAMPDITSAMAYATHIDADLATQNPKAVSYRHIIYFMVKQEKGTLSNTAVTDEMSATEARFQTDDMVQDLLAYLFTLKDIANGKTIPSDLPKEFIPELPFDKLTQQGLRGLQLDGAHWGTLPGMLNGWQLCGLTIEQIIPRELCIKLSHYNIPSEEAH